MLNEQALIGHLMAVDGFLREAEIMLDLTMTLMQRDDCYGDPYDTDQLEDFELFQATASMHRRILQRRNRLIVFHDHLYPINNQLELTSSESR